MADEFDDYLEPRYRGAPPARRVTPSVRERELKQAAVQDRANPRASLADAQAQARGTYGNPRAGAVLQNFDEHNAPVSGADRIAAGPGQLRPRQPDAAAATVGGLAAMPMGGAVLPAVLAANNMAGGQPQSFPAPGFSPAANGGAPMGAKPVPGMLPRRGTVLPGGQVGFGYTDSRGMPRSVGTTDLGQQMGAHVDGWENMTEVDADGVNIGRRAALQQMTAARKGSRVMVGQETMRYRPPTGPSPGSWVQNADGSWALVGTARDPKTGKMGGGNVLQALPPGSRPPAPDAGGWESTRIVRNMGQTPDPRYLTANQQPRPANGTPIMANGAQVGVDGRSDPFDALALVQQFPQIAVPGSRENKAFTAYMNSRSRRGIATTHGEATQRAQSMFRQQGTKPKGKDDRLAEKKAQLEALRRDRKSKENQVKSATSFANEYANASIF